MSLHAKNHTSISETYTPMIPHPVAPTDSAVAIDNIEWAHVPTTAGPCTGGVNTTESCHWSYSQILKTLWRQVGILECYKTPFSRFMKKAEMQRWAWRRSVQTSAISKRLRSHTHSVILTYYLLYNNRSPSSSRLTPPHTKKKELRRRRRVTGCP